jgi:hypothetical protein
VSDRYSVSETESGLLIAGPAVGFRFGEDFELPTEPEEEPKPQNVTAVASKTIPKKTYRRPVQRRITDDEPSTTP